MSVTLARLNEGRASVVAPSVFTAPGSGGAAPVVTTGEIEGEVAVAVSTPTLSKGALEPVVPTFDEDGPVWPSESAEAAFLAEHSSSVGASLPLPARTSLPRPGVDEADEKTAPTPSLDALIARIPAETRETLEDLFRVKFTGVRRVSRDVLK